MTSDPVRPAERFLVFGAPDVRAEEIAEVVGTRVEYLKQDWTWFCVHRPTNNSRCDPRTRYTLESSVDFVEVPNHWHLQNVSRFWVIQSELDCPGDTCWKDMFHAFQTFSVVQDRSFVARIGLSLVFCFITSLVIIKPYL